MNTITLTPAELSVAAFVGAMRQVSSVSKGSREAHGSTEQNGWNKHVEGACGECAYAKFANVYWSPTVNTYKAPDVDGVQVKTRSKSEYELLVRDDDADDHPFVLVTGMNGRYVVRGWLYGHEAKRPEWKQGHGGREPAYFAPQSALRPMEELRQTAGA